jgi:hypothetical protein
VRVHADFRGDRAHALNKQGERQENSRDQDHPAGFQGLPARRPGARSKSFTFPTMPPTQLSGKTATVSATIERQTDTIGLELLLGQPFDPGDVFQGLHSTSNAAEQNGTWPPIWKNWRRSLMPSTTNCLRGGVLN